MRFGQLVLWILSGNCRAWYKRADLCICCAVAQLQTLCKRADSSICCAVKQFAKCSTSEQGGASAAALLWALSGNCNKLESGLPRGNSGYLWIPAEAFIEQIFYLRLLQGRLRRLRSRRPRRRSRNFWRLSAPGGGWMVGPQSAAPPSPSSPASASGDRRRPPQVTHPDYGCSCSHSPLQVTRLG